MARLLQDLPVIVMVVEGDEAVARMHDAAGSTAPGESTRITMRRRYGHASDKTFMSNKNGLINNTVHTSGTNDEAKVEIPNFFELSEISSYRFVYSRYAY